MPKPKKTKTVKSRSVNPWTPVVFSSDCDEDGNCPKCKIDFAECSCPGPTQDGYEYKVSKSGIMYARKE